MDQTLHNRTLGNCSLSDHKTQNLSSSSQFTVSPPSAQESLLCGSKPSPGGTWEPVSSKLGSKAAQPIQRAKQSISKVHRGLLHRDKSTTVGTGWRVFLRPSCLPSSERTEVSVCSQQFTEGEPLLLLYVLCMTHLTSYQVAQALEFLVPPCLMLVNHCN